jgi:hypothetical protein
MAGVLAPTRTLPLLGAEAGSKFEGRRDRRGLGFLPQTNAVEV